MLRKVVFEAFEGVEFSFAAPESRWVASRWCRVALEFHALRPQLAVQDRLQSFGGNWSQWKSSSALRATFASPETREATDEGAVRGADDRVEKEAFANAANHEVFLRDDFCPERFVWICDGVEDVETRAR